MKTADFDYELPPERIAQTPIEPRDAARLLVLNRETGERIHTRFKQLGNFLTKGDLLVVNRSRVIPARLFARKAGSGGKVELLLLEQDGPKLWRALVGGKGVGKGALLELANGARAEVVEEAEGGQCIIRFDMPDEDLLGAFGKVPLPPYIKDKLDDPERYQTVYAREAGSAAAPTAGLHFTPELIERLKAQGVAFAEVLLHIGLDTFAPVHEERAEAHSIHSEWCRLGGESAAAINATRRRKGRIVAVGTTSVRLLESAARSAAPGEAVAPFEGRTDLFILPGHRFQATDAMLTNFHLPRSTLLILVSAFAERELILQTYREAIAEGYRFYSFGDAMLIL